MKTRLPAAIAMSAGLLTLLGYFIAQPTLLALRLAFVDWAGTLAAVALLIGVLNLLNVHWTKARKQSPGWLYSIFLVLTLIAVLSVGLAGPYFPVAAQASQWIFRHIQTSLEASLAALLAFFLLFAGFRLMRDRPSVFTLIFVTVALITLMGLAPLDVPGAEIFTVLRAWIAQVPAVAGARGLLLGVALGIVATGLRVLLALDRPYGE